MGISNNRASLLAFVTAAATLFLQVLVHRLVSAKLLNNYAFLVISLTMLGFAVSGSLLTLGVKAFLRRIPETASVSAALFVLTALLATVLFCGTRTSAPFAISRPSFVLGFLRWTPFALLFALPFTFAGLTLGALLSAEQLSARRVYFFDLLGSAFGALARGPRDQPHGRRERSVGRMRCSARRDPLRPATAIPDGTGPRNPDRARARARHLEAGRCVPADLRRRIDTGEPHDHGRARRLGPLVAHRGLTHPSFGSELGNIRLAGGPRPPVPRHLSEDAHPERLRLHLRRGLRRQPRVARRVSNRPSTLRRTWREPRNDPKSWSIGVGGGFDILNALHFEASDVTGVEVNRATYKILTRTYRDYFRAWVEDPRVHVVNERGTALPGHDPAAVTTWSSSPASTPTAGPRDSLTSSRRTTSTRPRPSTSTCRASPIRASST